MRRNHLLSLLLAGGIALASGAASAATELKASNWLPPKFPNSLGYVEFIKVAEKETNGALKFRLFTGGALLGAKATLDGVRDGVADVGHIVYTYFPATFPTEQLIGDLAMIGVNHFAASAALTELQMLQCPPCQADNQNTNLVYLGSYSTPMYVMHSRKALKTMADLKGMKMRSGGPLWDRWAEFAGGVPVSIPSSDMYEGLERGQLDIAIYAAGGLKTHGLADVATHVTMMPLGAFRANSLFAFNEDTWSKLTTEERAALLKAAAAGVVETNIEYQKGDDAGLELARKKGISIDQPTPELEKALDQFIEKDLARTAEHAKSEYKVENPQAIIAKYKELYAKYDKLLKDKGNSKEQMVAVMWDNIFSKVDPATYGKQK